MARAFDPGALLARTWRLPGGDAVRLRLAHLGDEAQIALLARTSGLVVDELALREHLRSDPARRAVIVGGVLHDRGERIVAAGSIDLATGASPDLLLADAALGDELAQLLEAALRSRAEHHARRAA